MAEENISVLLDEKRVFNPKEEFVKQTNVKQWMEKHSIKTLDELYKKAENWEWFWEEISKELVEWYNPYTKVVEWDAPWIKWFIGQSITLFMMHLINMLRAGVRTRLLLSSRVNLVIFKS